MTRAILYALQLVLVFAPPALIAFFASRRWRLRGVVIWALAPLVILLVVAGRELSTGKTSPADLDNLIFGILLIGSFLLLPWLMACAAGYAIGAMLRRRRRPDPRPPARPPPRAPAAEPAAPPPPPVATTFAYEALVETGGPSLSPPGGWQAAHVGFENDGCELDGLPVWPLTWRAEAGDPVTLAHPAHPAQQHVFSIYAVDDGTRATRFAATELSNGAWGFYRWAGPEDAPVGESDDGTLRYVHSLGAYEHGRYDRTEATAIIVDVRSGETLFDGEDWQSGRVVPQADGSWLLSLAQGELQTLFRIDPPARTFRDLATPDSPRPLRELSRAAAAARAFCNDPASAYLGRQIAPDGSLRVELQAVEWSNTHWVRSPRVIEVATGRVLLDLWGTDWDAWLSFPRRGTVRLSFRRYRGGGGVAAEIELAAERYILFEPAGAVIGPLAEMPEALENAALRAVAAAPSRVIIPPRRATLRNWLVALLILVGTLALIAVATLITLHLQGEPAPQKLDTIPPMPSVPGQGDLYSPRAPVQYSRPSGE